MGTKSKQGTNTKLKQKLKARAKKYQNKHYKAAKRASKKVVPTHTASQLFQELYGDKLRAELRRPSVTKPIIEKAVAANPA